MKVVKIKTKLTAEEKETQLNYDFVNKTWTMDSTVQKHFNKALKQGWVPLTQFEYEDGTVAGYVLEAPGRAVTIRSTKPKQMSDKQMMNLLDADEDDDE